MSAAVDQFQKVLDARGRVAPASTKDKLAESKQAERDAKLRHQAEQQAAKGKKDVERLAGAQASRVGREFSGTSKRHVKDTKEAAKREAHRSTGKMCEHGVWRCNICFPPIRNEN